MCELYAPKCMSYMCDFGIQKSPSSYSISHTCSCILPPQKMLSDPSTENIPSTKNTPALSPASFIKKFVAQVLYEATLQDLLHAQNYAAFQLLKEYNDLVDQR